MAHLQGGIFTRSHTTVIDVSETILRFVETLPDVTKITIGRIDVITKSRKSSARVVKIIDEKTCIRLDMTQKRSKQTVRVYTDDPQTTKLAIARYTRNIGYELRFRKSE